MRRVVPPGCIEHGDPVPRPRSILRTASFIPSAPESRGRAELQRMKKKLESDINELEIALDHANKANSDAQKNLRRYQDEIKEKQMAVQRNSVPFICNVNFSADRRRATTERRSARQSRSRRTPLGGNATGEGRVAPSMGKREILLCSCTTR